MHPTTYCPPPRFRESGASTAVASAPTLPDRVTRENAVLLVIDCQVGPLWDLEFGVVRRRIADLAGAARRSDVPMIVSGIDIDNRGPVIPELLAAHPGAAVVARSTANAWNDDAVRAAVRETGRSTLVVVGCAADLCVALCAMTAAADGLNVYAVLETPGTGPQSARWFGDRLIVTTSELVAESIEKRPARRSRPSLTRSGMAAQVTYSVVSPAV